MPHKNYFGCGVSEFLKILKHFILFYTTLILLCVPLICLIVWRNILSLGFLLFYKGRYFLVPTIDAFHSSNKLPNTLNINFIIFVKETCGINGLRKRILSNISATDKDWNIPYKLLFHACVQKFGFHCFEDKRNSFNINNHVRINPNVENTEQIYTESEMYEILEATAFQEWDDSRPRWELLIIPKIRRNATGQICSAIQINMSHVYGDGISLTNFTRNIILDQPSPKLSFDPVNPPIPRVTLIQKILLHIKVFFIGPHLLLKHSRCSKDQVLGEDRKLLVPSCQLLGRSNLQLSLETVKKIRKTFNCSTQAVFQSAFNGALKKHAKRKDNYPIPHEILGGVTTARFPYPNEYITNRAVLLTDLMPIGIEDRVSRLQKINTKLKNMSTPEAVLAEKLISILVGLLPARVKAFLFSTFKLAYFISNVPGVMGSATIMGKDVHCTFGFSPMVNGIRVACGLSCYNGISSPGFVVQESELFKTRKDLDQFIEDFDNELKYYITASSV